MIRRYDVRPVREPGPWNRPPPPAHDETGLPRGFKLIWVAVFVIVGLGATALRALGWP